VRKRINVVARRAFFTRLVEQAQKTKFFGIDDAWVTGMLGKHNKMLSMKVVVILAIYAPEIYTAMHNVFGPQMALAYRLDAISQGPKTLNFQGPTPSHLPK
jgi:hypothetical protein